MLTIGPEMEVSLHFSLALESGDVVDTTVNQKPGTFCIGDETLPIGFEKLLVGLKAGDRRSFLVPPEQGFGARQTEHIQRFKAKKLLEIVEEPLSDGLTVVFKDASGHHVPGVIRDLNGLEPTEIKPDQLISVDFNHPLAGRHLHFSVEILDVKPKAQPVQIQPYS
mgnify:CR=1 FL=1